MTPEERANKAGDEWERGDVTFLAVVAQAIRQAEAAERKRCIAIVRDVLQQLSAESSECMANSDHGTALRKLVECDGAMRVLTAITEAP